MQFLTTCRQCGQTVRRDATTCPVCGSSPSLKPLADAPNGARRGKERLTWASMIGTGLEQTGYGLGGLAAVDGLLFILQARDARLLPWFGALTGACLIMIFTGRYMRDNLQHTSAIGLGALTHFLFRVYPSRFMGVLVSCSGLWAFVRWLDFTSRSPDRAIAGWTFLTLFLIAFTAESLRSALADDADVSS